MGVKAKITDFNQAAECVHWLQENIGAQIPHSGSAILGLGWRLDCNLYDRSYLVEVTDDVDEETQTMFLLKWA